MSDAHHINKLGHQYIAENIINNLTHDVLDI